MHYSRTAWVVRRRATNEVPGDEILPAENQLWAVYDTEEEAKQAARELELADMVVNGTTVKAFVWGFEAATTFPDYAFRDWLLDRDIPVPDGNTITDWRLWWVKIRDADRPLSREQFRHVLAALNKLPLDQYEAVEVPRGDPDPLDAVGYAVVHRSWVYNDVTFDGDNRPLTVYRTREAANAERTRRADADLRRDGPPHPDWKPHYSDPIDEYVVVELPLSPS